MECQPRRRKSQIIASVSRLRPVVTTHAGASDEVVINISFAVFCCAFLLIETVVQRECSERMRRGIKVSDRYDVGEQYGRILCGGERLRVKKCNVVRQRKDGVGMGAE